MLLFFADLALGLHFLIRLHLIVELVYPRVSLDVALVVKGLYRHLVNWRVDVPFLNGCKLVAQARVGLSTFERGLY